MSFASLGLSEKVLSAVTASGYTEPTPIQTQGIPPALQGRDILGIAQTGTGKTAAFVLPMLSRLESGRARARMPRTLILEPTRELAAQVEQSFEKYGINHKLNVALLIGGVAFGEQEQKIMRGADVLIATPGRLLDFYERGKLLLTGIDILVIDEADRMLDMGFIPDIEKICKLVPFTRQTLFFSATMPPEITRLTEQFLQNPLRIEVARLGATASTISQYLVAAHGGRDKRESLRAVLRGAENFRNAIIFANRKRDVAILQKSLVKHGFNAGALHGDMEQSARMASLEAFKNGDVALLVCSDVAARGLDIPDVSHVINFDIPTHPDDYVHRIGRTGRAGKTGVAITICTEDDRKYLDQIQELTQQKLEWLGPKLDELGPPSEPASASRRGGRRGAGEHTGERASGRSASGRSAGGRTAGARKNTRRETPVHDDAPETGVVAQDAIRPDETKTEGAPRKTRRRKSAAEAPAQERAQEHVQEPPVQGRVKEPVAASREREPAAERKEHRPQKSKSDAQQGQTRSTRPSRRRDDDDGPTPIGLGDHVPAFLMRPVPTRGGRRSPATVED